jgi:altronate dehydratase large subunit
VNIQNAGGSESAVLKGIALLQRLVAHSQRQPKTAGSLSEIILATECGGSDATSGLVANPVLGLVSDRLLENGGTSILSETTELIGAEHILAQRTRSPAIKDRLLAIAADLFEELVAVCNGKLTKAETLGHREMALFRVGLTF